MDDRSGVAFPPAEMFDYGRPAAGQGVANERHERLEEVVTGLRFDRKSGRVPSPRRERCGIRRARAGMRFEVYLPEGLAEWIFGFVRAGNVPELKVPWMALLSLLGAARTVGGQCRPGHVETRFLEFFAAQIRNRHTRRAYAQATGNFWPGASAPASRRSPT